MPCKPCASRPLTMPVPDARCLCACLLSLGLIVLCLPAPVRHCSLACLNICHISLHTSDVPSAVPTTSPSHPLLPAPHVVSLCTSGRACPPSTGECHKFHLLPRVLRQLPRARINNSSVDVWLVTRAHLYCEPRCRNIRCDSAALTLVLAFCTSRRGELVLHGHSSIDACARSRSLGVFQW